MDYRKFYEKQTKLKLPKNFEVHHIDFNRNNNKISNLVALPRNLHKKYHNSICIFSRDFKPNIQLVGICDYGNGYNEYYKYSLEVFMETYKDCQIYIDFRDYLLGKIPNIHNLGETYEV